jgi:hypothetical protein
VFLHSTGDDDDDDDDDDDYDGDVLTSRSAFPLFSD